VINPSRPSPAFRTASDKSWAWRPGNEATVGLGQRFKAIFVVCPRLERCHTAQKLFCYSEPRNTLATNIYFPSSQPPPGTHFTTRKRKKVIPISTLCPSQDKKEDLVGISVGDICAHERVKLKITEYRH